MIISKQQVISLILIILLAVPLLVACGTSSLGGSTGNGAGTDGLSLMQSRCSVCHSNARVTSAHKSAADWKVTVDRMILRGAKLNAAEEQTLIDYLAANYR